jgi:hypothetical protein
MPVYPGAPPDFLTLSRSLLPDLLYPFSVVAQR